MQDDTPETEDLAPEPAAPVPAPPDGDEAPPRRRGLAGRLFFWLAMLTLVLPVGCTAVYRVVPPPVTILMLQRAPQHGIDRDWVPMRRIAPALPLAVIAAEDARYCEHGGFDFEAIEKAMESNKRGRKLRGGSTISQQAAKNVFLWPSRSYVRKGLEAYFTVLVEAIWGKRRIMEVYLNSVEWGPGTYGAEAAARKYFGVGADRLTTQQAARLAAILPSPLKWKAANPGPYVARRSRRIAAASGVVRREGLADCIGALPKSKARDPEGRRESRRKAAEQIMQETAPPPLPEEAFEPAPDPLEGVLPPPEELALEPAPPAETPAPAEAAEPLPPETPAAP